MSRARIILIYIFTALCIGAWAQKPIFKARLAPDSISIGDRFTVELTVDKDLTQVIGFPEFDSARVTEKLELVLVSEVDTIAREGRRVTLRKSYTMTTFDEGKYNLGKIGVLYMDKNITDTLYCGDSLMLQVTTFPIDTLTQQIYDIKPPMETPVVFAEYGIYLIFALFVAQLIFALVYIIIKLRKKREAKAKMPKAKLEPPHVVAIRQLEMLQEQKLWQNNRPKLYYTRLTDIIREYLEERYGIKAMEMTSDEIFDALAEIIADKRTSAQLRRLLTTSDYVKFAKYVPSVEDNEMSFDDAYHFVEDTKLESAVNEEDTKGGDQ